MSRSYRKHTFFSLEYDRFEKKYSNRKVRRSKGLYQNSDYKKIHPSWKIRFGKLHYNSEDDFVHFNYGYGETEQELREIYRHYFKSK